MSKPDDDGNVVGEETSLLKEDNNNKSDKAKKKNNKNDSTVVDLDERTWKLTTFSLAMALLVQSYLLVSVFPYSGFLAMHLVPNLNEETAGTYAGWIASSFMIGRTFSSFHWGKAADIYGRTFVIQSSLVLSAFFSILFGLAPSFRLALFWRFLMGLSNGLIGPVKTLVSEISGGDPTRETKSLAIIFGMWGYGFLVNPAISGYVSDPVKQYPNLGLFAVESTSSSSSSSSSSNAITSFLIEYPFFVPNLVGSIFCLAAYACIAKFVEETLPIEKRKQFRLVTASPKALLLLRSVSSLGLFKSYQEGGGGGGGQATSMSSSNHQNGNDTTDIGKQQQQQQLPKWVRPSPSTTALTILSPSSSSSSNDKMEDEKTTTTPASKVQNHHQQQNPATIQNLWQRQSTRQHLLLYWFYSFGVISIDEIFPLFCISKDSGLGVQENRIGNILFGTGVFYVIIQYVLVTNLVKAFGYYKTMRIGSLLSLPLCFLIPLSLVTNRNAMAGELTWSTMAFLSVIYAIIRAFSSVTFSTITMTTNRTVPAHHRATMNGLAMLGGSLAKGIGPAFAGILFSSSAANITPPFGSVVVYCVIASLGLGLFVQSMLLQEPKDDDDDNVNIEKDQEIALSEAAVPDGDARDVESDEEEAPGF